jgi:hypothetical protein
VITGSWRARNAVLLVPLLALSGCSASQDDREVARQSASPARPSETSLVTTTSVLSADNPIEPSTSTRAAPSRTTLTVKQVMTSSDPASSCTDRFCEVDDGQVQARFVGKTLISPTLTDSSSVRWWARREEQASDRWGYAAAVYLPKAASKITLDLEEIRRAGGWLVQAVETEFWEPGTALAVDHDDSYAVEIRGNEGRMDRGGDDDGPAEERYWVITWVERQGDIVVQYQMIGPNIDRQDALALANGLVEL